ncbi:MAG: [FeFe] hydrogenase, group A [Ignavibacteria bacterium]|jgi:NADH-quinone oxidoreductase subunit G|nr:[FeFe] hydrogenase, group A [Ignavibacteria bacterium]
MKSLTIDNRIVSFENERNLLEVIKKTNIELLTFCYHSELSIYGACRLCIVEIDGRGIQTACTTKPEEGMVVHTNTKTLRNIRRTTVELLLSSYNHNCTTCQKNTKCRLQSIAKNLGITNVRFKKSSAIPKPIDLSSYAIQRNPNKCILCGDCVRACNEIQGIGAIDFAYRGANSQVIPAFGNNIASVDCVDCGQCSRVCPTGAIIPRSEIGGVWKELDNPNKVVVAHFAPSVRVAIGEEFGMPSGSIVPGQIVSALRMLGFDKVFDTSFTADLTIVEEANEFIKRKEEGGVFPMFTSCCPAWVKFTEQHYPELHQNLSSCRSPQAMFGSISKKYLPEMLKIDPKNLVVVSIMPCTAKKMEARREEFKTDGMQDNDYVLTTQEFATMIKQCGIQFNTLQPDSFDPPFGHKTGAGVIFGNSGGVTEAALRYIVEKVENKPLERIEFAEVRGEAGIRAASLTIAGEPVKIAVIHGLRNARQVIERIKSGEIHYDFIEVMSCPGGCIGGAGQPVYFKPETRKNRAAGLYNADKMLQQHKSQDNQYIKDLYKDHIGEIGGEEAHKVLHTHFHNRKRIFHEGVSIIDTNTAKLTVSICVGTNCFVNGAQDIMKQMLNYVTEHSLENIVDVKANFCMENCDHGPSVSIGTEVITKANAKKVISELEAQLEQITEMA